VLPTVASAYLYGRRHATLTALASILIVTLVGLLNSRTFPSLTDPSVQIARWLEVAGWGGVLVLTAILVGTLYDIKTAQLRELRDTYEGVLVVLRHIIAQDEYTDCHSYRVSMYATRIAEAMGFDAQRVQNTRTAALLHDIGKLDVSRRLLHKAAGLNAEEYASMQQHVDRGAQLLRPLGGPLGRVIPIILAHHDHYDGSGYHPVQGEDIPLEARVISVADMYDALISDRPYRRAMPTWEARTLIEKGSGKDFDPHVVEAFVKAWTRGELELPNGWWTSAALSQAAEPAARPS